MTIDKSIDFLVPFVEQKTFVDVGANSGTFAYHLKRRAKRVVAFEPNRYNADRIRRFNPSVEVHTCALSDVSGQRTLYVPYLESRPILTRCSLNADANPGFEIRPELVPVRRLDDYAIQGVGGLKIDVEGHELAVILGAHETIATSLPAMVIEIEERHHPGQSSRVIQTVKDMGYECYYLGGRGDLVDANGFDFDSLQNPANLPRPGEMPPGLYVSDFIFLPRKRQAQ